MQSNALVSVVADLCANRCPGAALVRAEMTERAFIRLNLARAESGCNQPKKGGCIFLDTTARFILYDLDLYLLGALLYIVLSVYFL